ncbi:N5-glutamine methyltransferase family protein [Corynebacterium comes]|uniref:N5-glutamine S-adenosyl-L-methionine-dependent methyltransferase n=1 Tax=Corynebacterium comes TaxID=2675218 RepID=A0A6B8W1H4_9CORY|nr:class I SAM-dependent methyltransferase [Corynebacterium comes]QGU04786.1 N5-glutamine S-adenosyl-L-methionine-dependent methyltransferase [Corynebacterium comes]
MTRTPLTVLAPELTALFDAAGLTAAGVAGHLGPDFTEAMHRGEPAAVRYVTSDGSTLSRLIRVFILRDAVPATELADLVGASLTTRLLDSGAAVSDLHGTVRMALDIRPHVIVGVNRWVFSDADASMTPHVPGPDHVLGVGAASLSLLQSTPVTPVGSALDLGTGSGVQALGQFGLAESITATDVHPRALDLAEATFAGADARVELLQGPWFEPVAGRTFDRIVANPPFVVGLPEVGHVYRDSGLNLDGASELVVSQAPGYLAPGGTAHLLAAWVHTHDQSWAQRVASWLPDRGVAAWVIERDVADPAHYVGTWLRDESIDPRSPEAAARTEAWLAHFAEHGVIGIGFGFVAIRNIGDEPSDILAESMPQTFSDPLGPEVEEYFARTAWLRDRSAQELADATFLTRPGLARENIAVADKDAGVGFAPAALRLTRTDGPRWSHDVDEHLAAVVSGLHPQGLSLAETVGLYAMANGLDEDELVQAAVPAVVDLIRHGLVLPAELAELVE